MNHPHPIATLPDNRVTGWIFWRNSSTGERCEAFASLPTLEDALEAYQKRGHKLSDITGGRFFCHKTAFWQPIPIELLNEAIELQLTQAK